MSSVANNDPIMNDAFANVLAQEMMDSIKDLRKSMNLPFACPGRTPVRKHTARYSTIGAAAAWLSEVPGITVTFDSDYDPQTMTIEIEGGKTIIIGSNGWEESWLDAEVRS